MSHDRFSSLSNDEQRRYTAQALGCNPDAPEGWPDRIVTELVLIRLTMGTRAYYERLGNLLSKYY